MRKKIAKALHYIFEAGITIKFIDGIIEFVAGLLLYLNVLGAIKGSLVGELLEDPHDIVARIFLPLFQHFATSQTFLGIYLLLHGIVKIGIVVALWNGKLWAYPLAGVVLVLFTIYQVYLFSISYSLFQLFLTLVDIIILVLLHFEYKRVTHHA